MKRGIIEKLKISKLKGRSGSGFLTWQKWKAVKEAKGKQKYIICNASEGEPGLFKDEFILENYMDEVINGMRIALSEIGGSFGYIYLNKNFYKKFKKRLLEKTKKDDILLFEKKGGYIAGEETSLMESMEGKNAEPRKKPPYPTQKGLWDCPTLINNVETFYYISKIDKGDYDNKRFFCVLGDIKNKGVFELKENLKIEEILRETKNYPDFDFFVQSGGKACGEILLPEELKKEVFGPASIIIYNRKTTDIELFCKEWVSFILKGNCDKCTPCREGYYRISEILEKGLYKMDKEILEDIFFVLKETSFCSLGSSAITPLKGIMEKIIKYGNNN